MLEEREQAEHVRAAVEAKNAALEAARRAKIEALKIRNWLLGQAMVQNALSQSGLSGREQERVRAEVRTRGVSAALGLVASLKQAAQARLVALEARITRMEERLDEAQQSGRSTTPSYPHRPPYPDPETADMTEAERLAEYKQSAAYQARQARYRQWEAQQAYQRYRQSEWADPQPMAQPAESKPLWQRAWDAITHPKQTLENALIQWGTHSQTGYQVIGGLANLTASMDDERRNPVTAAFGKALRDGIAGFTYGVQSTWDLTRKTFSSAIRGQWDEAKRYGGALLEGVVKGWIGGSIQTAAHLVWGAVKAVTPIGLFETGPAWWNAIKDARAGKRGGWDVALTSLFLMANLIGIAGAANGIKTSYDIRAFQDTLSPSARLEYTFLSRAEQIRILNAAKSTGASPAAIEFYLSEISRPGSPLARLPLADALKVSSWATETGQGPVLLDYISHGELASQPWIEYIPSNFRSKVVPAFEGEEAIPLKLTQSRVAYRYWGGNSVETGRPWLTVYSNLTPEQARSLLALPNDNLANHITPFLIPEDTVILVGKAASQVSQDWAGPYAIGGGLQIYVPDPSILIKLP